MGLSACTHPLSGLWLCHCHWDSACSSLVSGLLREGKKVGEREEKKPKQRKNTIRQTGNESRDESGTSGDKEETREDSLVSEVRMYTRMRWDVCFPWWTNPAAVYHLHHSESTPLSLIILLSFFCLQTTAWLCPATDGLVCGTATGCKNLTEHRYRAGFSSNAEVKHLTNFSTKPALFRSVLAWTWTSAKVWKLFVWTS